MKNLSSKQDYILEVSGLNVTFHTNRGSIRASQNISFKIRKGEVCVLVGETGSGKSVIGQAVLHILPQSAGISGSIKYLGEEILFLPEKDFSRLRGNEISLIPQNPTGSLDPLMKCKRQISEVLEYVRKIPAEMHDKEIKTILSGLGFSDPDTVAESYPHELSGGMRQRVATGIAMASKPRFMVADEPTKGLDYAARKSTIDLFLSLKKNHSDSILMITHDLELAQTVGDYVGVLYSGEIIEFGSCHDVFKDPKHPYTKGLIAALPKNGMEAMPGICPGFASLPKGCYFYERCPCSCSCEKGKIRHPDLYHYKVCDKPENYGRSVRCHRFSE
ncbi:peptide/nickel transport system ATP-binding protein [Methanomicrobium sp. W14]|uniref:ABC transporter ATP-binding protein n=1 Tax=Methanomicrobium sp. W14 TaxID=2817839 RepID=UPI001AEA4CBF|nr:ABC transporter ATP-binding protein [Methanomicrobium sp. W14]MBP2132210.1 peptide/nickel transport system ATP-binding protein [Methanomicrobium sp. W14]